MPSEPPGGSRWLLVARRKLSNLIQFQADCFTADNASNNNTAREFGHEVDPLQIRWNAEERCAQLAPSFPSSYECRIKPRRSLRNCVWIPDFRPFNCWVGFARDGSHFLTSWILFDVANGESFALTLTYLSHSLQAVDRFVLLSDDSPEVPKLVRKSYSNFKALVLRLD
jgi:hypothetical protein